MLQEYNNTFQTWDRADFLYLEHFLGEDYSDNISKMEEDKIHLETEKMEVFLQEALEFQRKELMEKLAIVQSEFMMGLENEVEEFKHLLCISRAFIYSYFSRVPEQTYSVPE